MNVDVALAEPGVLFFVWIALPLAFVGLAWWVSGRGSDSALLRTWAAATILLAAVSAWLAQGQESVAAASTWSARSGAFLKTAVVLGAGLAVIALLSRRQRTRGVRVLTVGLIASAVAAYVGVVLVLFLASVAIALFRDVAAAPVIGVLAA